LLNFPTTPLRPRIKMTITAISKQLQHFLNKLPPKLHLHPLIPTTKTTQILHQWIDQLTEIHTQNQNRPPIESQTLPNIPQPPSTFWNWIPEPIRSNEIPKLHHFTESTFQVHHPTHTQPRQVSIYISSTAPSHQKQHTEFINRIHLAVQLLTHYAPPQCHTPPLHIYLYLTKATKTLPQLPEQILNETHANTAFTTSCNMDSTAPTANQSPKYIILFREEEVFKVLLHELFHVLGLDFSHDSLATEKTAQFIREHFQLTLKDIRLFETYCETWATILNCLILAFHHSISQPLDNKHRNDEIQKEFFRLFSYEQTYVLFQCAKLLHYHKLSYSHLTSHSKTITKGGNRNYSQLQKRKTIKTKSITIKKIKGGKKGNKSLTPQTPQEYKEDTQIFCYYILKSAVFQNIQIFLQRFPPPFSLPESNAFASFVQKCFIHSSFEKKLHMYTALFDPSIVIPDIQPLCKHPQPLDKPICETMRQTVNEMSISSDNK